MSGPTVTGIAPGVRQLTFVSVVTMHVYLIETPDGVIALDAAVKGVGEEILAAAGGRIERLILSHSHPDHRGAAPELGVPIHCHPDEVQYAESDGGRGYLEWDLVENPMVREGLPRLHEMWDSGPLSIDGTIEEGETIAGFRVVHVPGHAPGQIALHRESDRLVLAPDIVFTLDEMGQDVPARLPPPAFNWDSDRARASIEKVRALSPASVWVGHGASVTSDVDAQLAAAAAWT